MFDKHILRCCKQSLQTVARVLVNFGLTADLVTIIGFTIGLLAVFSLWLEWYLLALCLILVNRILDGLDGEVARLLSATDRGAFLDIVCDFIFYAGVVLGFSLANPGRNGLAATFLLFSFMGTASSFLAFAIMAERRNLESLNYPAKGFYYLGGLTEGSETILFFILCCLLPGLFPWFACLFGGLCIITTITRIIFGYNALQRK